MRPRRRRQRAEGGYTLATLAVAVTVMSLVVALALPMWSQAIQREKEEELIARGLQIAEAIRVFRGKFGRLPVRLEELVEVKPRTLRRLWKDPMTDDGKWGLLFEGIPQQQADGPNGRPPSGRPTLPPPTGDSRGGTDPVADPFAQNTGLDGEQVTIGPIQGVYSKSKKESIKVFFDKTSYDQWQFTYQMLVSSSGFNTPGAGANLAMGTRPQWLGRPWRPGIVPPGLGQPSGQQSTGLQPGGGGFGTPGGKPQPQPSNKLPEGGDEEE